MATAKKWGIVAAGIVAAVVVTYFLLAFLTGFGIGISQGSTLGALSFVGASVLVAPLLHVTATQAAGYLSDPKN